MLIDKELKIDPKVMHNDVKRRFCGSNVHCGSCRHARIQYGIVFPRSGKLCGSNADLCSDVVGPSSSYLSDWFSAFR